LAGDRRLLIFLPLTPPSELSAVMRRISEALRSRDANLHAYRISTHSANERTRDKLTEILGLDDAGEFGID